MVKYTSSKKADAVVEKDLKIVKEILVRRINPVSIILFGGFGRGEGSFEIIGNKIRPLNDYDMYVVTKNKIPDKILEEVGMECSKAIGRGGKEFVETYNSIYDKNEFFHVDLRCIVESSLPHLQRINRTFELKYGSTIIYGEDVRKKIKIDSIPLSEAFRYLINPACHLLLCMDSRRLAGKFRKDEAFYTMHHIIKTYLACASSLLISEGKFQPNYTKTNEEFQKIYRTKFPDLAKRIDESIRLKIYPRKEIKNVKERWFQARDDLTFCLRYLAEKHLGIKESDDKMLMKKIYAKLPFTYFTPYLPFGFLSSLAFPAQYALNLLYFRRTGYLKVLFGWRDVGLRIAMAAFLLLYGIDDKSFCHESARYIGHFANIKSENWEDLRVSLLYGFDRYFSQKLI
jgi:predicted nucleotidyltransferase